MSATALSSGVSPLAGLLAFAQGLAASGGAAGGLSVGLSGSAALLLFLAGAVAAAINSVAGGGSLVSFPMLVLLGVPPVQANATNSAALSPGSLSAALGIYSSLGPGRRDLWRLLPTTVLGAALGAWLLCHTSARLFNLVVPPLLLLATVLLWQRPRLSRFVTERGARGAAQTRQPAGGGASLWLAALVQLLISVYGGYFGAGMGILMLAAFSLLLPGDTHQINAVRNWLAFVINAVAALLLLSRGLVLLWPGLALMAGALCGGFFAARLSRRIPAQTLHRGVVLLGFFLTLWFSAQALRSL